MPSAVAAAAATAAAAAVAAAWVEARWLGVVAVVCVVVADVVVDGGGSVGVGRCLLLVKSDIGRSGRVPWSGCFCCWYFCCCVGWCVWVGGCRLGHCLF